MTSKDPLSTMTAPRLLSVMVVLALTALASAECGVKSVEVAPGICQPFVSLGTGSGLYFHHANVTQILDDWFDVGGKAVDTALIYRNQAQVGASLRPGIFVTTKIPCTDYATARKNVVLCLKLLGIPVVDMMLIHSPKCYLGGNVNETWRALEEIQGTGKVRSIGVSNFLKEDLEVSRTGRARAHERVGK